MLTVFFLKNRSTGVSRKVFETYMTDERPPLLESIEEIESYELWFPADGAAYDSIEALTFSGGDAMDRGLGSPIAEELHETGSQYIDFEAEEFLVMESVRTF